MKKESITASLIISLAVSCETIANEPVKEREVSPTGMTASTNKSHPFPVDDYREQLLKYERYSTRLSNIGNDEYPYNGFSIHLDRAGTAHLQSSCGLSDIPRSGPTNTSHGLLIDWNQRLTFLRRDKGWTRLTLIEAENLWGKPRVQKRVSKCFFTFDAFGCVGDERNLYHLDLQPASDGKIEAYRVRGIGITKPIWVTEVSKH